MTIDRRHTYARPHAGTRTSACGRGRITMASATGQPLRASALLLALVLLLAAEHGAAATAELRGLQIALHAATDNGTAGYAVAMVVDVASDASGGPRSGTLRLWPFVNGHQWGAPITIGGGGRARAETQLVLPPSAAPVARIVYAALPSQPTGLVVGMALPAGAVLSNVVSIAVQRLPAIRWPFDPRHVVAMEWEPYVAVTGLRCADRRRAADARRARGSWFTPQNVRWQTAEAIPMLGQYNSTDEDVIRIHAFWLAYCGVDAISARQCKRSPRLRRWSAHADPTPPAVVDWTNNLWGMKHFSERLPYAQELINATTRTLEVYARMRAEGYQTPRVILLMGLDNGPNNTITALNEQIQWTYANYLDRFRDADLFVPYEGMPLLVAFDGGNMHPSLPDKIDATRYTIRWMASQLQDNHFDRLGYWSWMDGSITPVPTLHNGTVEVSLPRVRDRAAARPTADRRRARRPAQALTPTVAFFAQGGWLNTKYARARRGGSTFVLQMNEAIATSPRFLVVCQARRRVPACAPMRRAASVPLTVRPYASGTSSPASPRRPARSTSTAVRAARQRRRRPATAAPLLFPNPKRARACGTADVAPASPAQTTYRSATTSSQRR